jgi:plasmid replication initiation protein
MRLFELLSAFKDTGKWVVSIQEYRELMDCKEKYDNTKLLLKYTLQEPLEELEKTDCAFEYKEIYNANHIGKGRKPVSALEFTLKKVKLKEIPASWYTFSDDHKRVLTSLKDKFKITESNITTYAPIIGIDGAKKLLREWEIKEASQKRIDDKVKYCNAVWVRVGKEVKKSQEMTV